MSSNPLSLVGKTAIVTGSARENGIGAAIARTLARNGANVAIHYVTENSAKRAETVAAAIAKEFGVKTTVVQGALEKVESSDKIVQETLKGLDADHIDILVNNAGFGDQTPLLEARPESYEYQFGVNVFGTSYMIQSVVKLGQMPQGGRIINIGTIASKISTENSAIYAASKAAQDCLTASWASVLGKSRGITVNCIAPGPVATDLARPFLEKPDGSKSDFFDTLINSTRAAERIGTADDIADAVLLLASEQSRWITAQWIGVSGGITGTM